LRSIVLIIKKLLARYNLNKPYSGGLNSYSIVLMTSSFLHKFGINNVSALSQNLSEFFSFFGNFFDPTVLGMDGSHFFNLTLEQQLM
jgi:DNA polymerase sigma